VWREHLERLRPACPTCRAAGREPAQLVLATVARADGDDVLEGVLVCPERLCRREHPIVDGIPVVVSDLVGWAPHQLDAAIRRADLTPFTESLLGDAAGPDSSFYRERANLSSYGSGHWGDLDPDERERSDGGLAELLESALALLDEPPRGPWLDAGCALGRGALELARRTGELAVGVDLSFAMLRVAERVRREGRAVYPLRRVGLVFDRCDFPIAEVPARDLSFWCCDAGVLPFADAVFAGALSLNVVDCVASPLGHLLELGRVVEPGSPVLLSTPYDWSPTATLVEDWIGGHSQRGESHGSSAAALRRILSPDPETGVDTGLVVVAQRDRVPWRVYANERSSIHYQLDLMRLERRA
jgi:SAM-dependent methyltransferase